MLTVLHPQVKPQIASFQGGLLPVRLPGDKNLSLVVKVSKEMILAAKMRGGFAFYLPKLPSTSGLTTSLVTAFFDDADQPLTLTSALFGDDAWAQGILEILGYDQLDVYFFDDQNYEWLSYRTTLDDPGSCLIGEDPIYLLDYHPQTAQGIHSALQNWFGWREEKDDEQAIRVVFSEPLSPEDLYVMDMTVENNSYLGSGGFRRDSLTRDDPGYYQERDISVCLLRAFDPNKIMMNPRRKDNNKEILDHLVLTDDVAVLIQAKDSPTTEVSLGRSIDRKRQMTHQQIGAAIKQINGAARYLAREKTAKLVVGGKDVEVTLGKRRVIGLTVVKELFDDEGEAYAVACADMADLSCGGMVMDYSSFHAFTHHFSNERGFIAALELLAREVRSGKWIKPKEFVVESVLAMLAEHGDNSEEPL
jgi:hypothetical protein